MKKAILLFCLLLLLGGCHKEVREDHYVLGLDEERVFAPGFDTLQVLEDIGFETELEGDVEKGESVKTVLWYQGENVGEAVFANMTKKTAPVEECRLVYLDLYVMAVSEILILEGEAVPASIYETCEKYEGDYLYKNGIACVIQKEEKPETVILHGDISALDQDRIDRLEVIAE